MVHNVNAFSSVLDAIRGGNSLAGPILATLVQWKNARQATSIADLARGVGGTPSSTMREVNRLVELDLVTSEEVGRSRNLRFNSDSPFASAILDVLFIAYGASSDPKDGPFAADDGSASNSISDYMPPELKTGIARWGIKARDISDDPIVNDGPTPEESRAFVLELRLIHNDAVRTTHHLRMAYSQWQKERDRTLIHALLNAGEGSNYSAAQLLKGSLSITSVTAGAISQLDWARAVYGASAEARTHRIIVDYLAKEIEARDEWDEAHRTVNAANEWAALDQSTPEWQQRSDAAVDVIAKIEERLPGIRDVGLAGERLLIIAARETWDRVHKTTVRMADHPSFRNWKRSYPDIAERYPCPPDEADSP